MKKKKVSEFVNSREDYEIAAVLSILCFVYGIIDHKLGGGWLGILSVYGAGLGVYSHVLYITKDE